MKGREECRARDSGSEIVCRWSAGVLATGVKERASGARKVDMIRLTRLNNHPLVLNSDLIKFIEAAPDTVITLITGEKVVVLEEIEEVLKLIVNFRRELLAGLAPAGAPANLPPVVEAQLPAGEKT